MSSPDPAYVQWLIEHSMLYAARARMKLYAGQGRVWQRPFANARPREAAAVASVWFTAYPSAIITKDGETVLQALGDLELWQMLSAIGIQGMHIGPTKRAGGISGTAYTPTVDGNFDRISFDIDPQFGTQEQFVAMSKMAAAFNAVIIDDVIPAHTGKGADFRLAEMGVGDYPGLYHMIQIKEEDWQLLPTVAEDQDSANLSPSAVDALRDKGYIVGQLQRVIFFEPGVKETDWSATAAITGPDGVARRWVYLHYFKAGQPSLNWLDPTFSAQQLVVGDALHALDELGARFLRFDANGFLGVERGSAGTAWSEGHPLSVVGNQLLAGMVRKAGGFSFQELNLTLDDIAMMSKGGADLSYDFITRAAYVHALMTGDSEFLRMMLRMVRQFGIDPASLIHAMQNHDEFTIELVHFWTLHANDSFQFHGNSWTGSVLRDDLRTAIYEAASGERAPYNLKFVTNGIAATTASLIAAALGIRDLQPFHADPATLSVAQKAEMTEQVALIRKVHLLLVMYNAFQPGVFAISGWDLIGALPLRPESVAGRLQDGDTRWIVRGAYDLSNHAPDQEYSADGVPRAPSLYGSLEEQLRDPNSFASSVKKMLAVRQASGLAQSEQIAIPDVRAPGLLVLVHELPLERGKQITALNFGREAVFEEVEIPGLGSGSVFDMIDERPLSDLPAGGRLIIELKEFSARSLRIIDTVNAPA